eukprot:4769-Heterococcus_DN1.PRE.1
MANWYIDFCPALPATTTATATHSARSCDGVEAALFKGCTREGMASALSALGRYIVLSYR